MNVMSGNLGPLPGDTTGGLVLAAAFKSMALYIENVPLVYALDFQCPIVLPPKPTVGPTWPLAESSRQARQTNADGAYLRRRWLETLYLPEVLSPLQRFAEDAQAAVSVAELSTAFKPLLRTLPDIEKRHRKVLRPYIEAIVNGRLSEEAAQSPSGDDVESDEWGAIRFGIELRCTSRMVEDGQAVHLRKLVEELERREILLQTILLLLLIPTFPGESEAPRKKKRRRDSDQTMTLRDPAKDPWGALELLMDRLGVWHAVADLGIETATTAPQPAAKAKREAEGIQSVLGRFWESVVVPLFLPLQPELSATFYLKVFGHPIPAKYRPEQASTKKPRKPKLTHARPATVRSPTTSSSNQFPVSSAKGGSSDTQSNRRMPSRAPSEVSIRVSPPRELSIGHDRQRSLSRASTEREPLRRSRSRSMDPQVVVAHSQSVNSLVVPNKKAIIRAPSGKDLFKGREVGLMRRTASFISRKERDPQSQGQGQSQVQSLGLLGRKTSDPIRVRRGSNDESARPANAIIMATPSKPRPTALFGARPSAPTFLPTPIQEEPHTMERRRGDFIAETPMGHRRVNTAPLHWSGVMETPMMPSRHSDPNLLSRSLRTDEDEGEDSDPLGNFMDMTDEEDEWDDDQAGRAGQLVPETPAR